MIRTLQLGGVFLSLAMLLASRSASSGEKEPIDITDKVRELNSAKYAAPPVEFRRGKVTPHELDPRAVEKPSPGFTIQLPSKARVPTPTIYRNRLYASGGFHSKTFFCFSAD